jgi:uncharacterized OB-fold protein
MGLIKCSECNNEVSSKASSCPKCGAPIAIDNASSSEVTGEAQVTIQETSKVFKLHTIYSIGIILFGAFIINFVDRGSPVPGFFIVIGLIYLVIVRLRAWWHHG